MTENTRSYTNESTRNDRLNAVLYGVAVGDALGGPVEFLDAETIRSNYGTLREMVGGGWLHLKPGEITDDTQMTLCVAHGITEKPGAPVEEIGKRFVEWYKSGPKDVGSTCAMSISTAMRFASDNGGDPNAPSYEEWFAASSDTHMLSGGRSAGNGTLMRTAYVGAYYQTEKNVADYAGFISDMTHYDPLAYEACIAYSLMIHRMIREDDPAERLAIIPATIDESHHEGVYDCDALASNTFTPSPSGYVVDSFRAALHCILTTSTFEDAVVKAVNLGGDADTIGAITGGLAGALYGINAIPDRWTKYLANDIRAEINILNRAALAQFKD